MPQHAAVLVGPQGIRKRVEGVREVLFECPRLGGEVGIEGPAGLKTACWYGKIL